MASDSHLFWSLLHFNKNEPRKSWSHFPHLTNINALYSINFTYSLRSPLEKKQGHSHVEIHSLVLKNETWTVYQNNTAFLPLKADKCHYYSIRGKESRSSSVSVLTWRHPRVWRSLLSGGGLLPVKVIVPALAVPTSCQRLLKVTIACDKRKKFIWLYSFPINSLLKWMNI